MWSRSAAATGADGRPGSVCAVLGPNGAGKTTAVRILATLLLPDGGCAEVAGFDVVRQARQVRYRIGLVGQHTAVDEVLSGRQNLVMFGRLFHLSPSDARRRATELLAQFGLADAGSKPAGQYSGGMRRRLDLAASLILAPPVLFLDEPTTGLDPRGRNEVWSAVRALDAAGIEVVDVALRPPTLDEVFLHLTGQPGADVPESGPTAKDVADAATVTGRDLVHWVRQPYVLVFGLEATMLAVTTDVARGVTDRFRSMPMAPSAVVAGRAGADMLHAVVGLAVMIAFGLLVGWRWNEGLLRAAAAVGLLLLLRFAVVWLGVYLGLVASLRR